MSRRNSSVFDRLVLLPWWINLILAGAVYLALKLLLPLIPIRNQIYKINVLFISGFAPLFALILLLAAGLSALHTWRKGRLLDQQKGIGTIRRISWQEFEELVGEAYRRRGYRVSEIGGGGADGGVDLILQRGGEKLLVQCKQWRMTRVGVKIARELFGVVAAEGATGGIVISSGTFTQEAQDFAKGKPLELIGGQELLKMVQDVQKTPTQKDDAPTEILCPRCGSKMVLRTATRGSHTGEQFWGCSAFPKCRATKEFRG